MSMTPDEIRESSTATDEMLMGVAEANDLAFRRLRELLEGIDYEEHTVSAQKLAKAFSCVKQVQDFIGEVTELNHAYYQTANTLEAEAAKSSSDDLDQLVEQVKAAMAGADPGTDVVFVVRKEDSAESTTLDEYQNEAFKRYSEALHDKREAELRLQRRKGLFT